MGGGSVPRGESHKLVKVAKWYERFFGQRMDAHICVTNAMREWLYVSWGINAVVLHDKPPSFFHKCSVKEKHELFKRLQWFSSNLDTPSINISELSFAPLSREKRNEDFTLFTKVEGYSKEVETYPTLREDRPALIVSSTSWTVDEDFQVLFDAIVRLDSLTKDNPNFPSMIFLITGKGRHYNTFFLILNFIRGLFH